jgi:hypothetical protein
MFDDVFTGDAANETADGFAGADTLGGGLGADNLMGGAGGDTLSGGDGVDQLAGGADNDTLFGGAGDDVLVGDWMGYAPLHPRLDRVRWRRRDAHWLVLLRRNLARVLARRRQDRVSQ